MSLDPYALLGVTVNSSGSEVRKQYLSLASMCHPDRGGNASDMQVVHDAYKYVSQQVALNRQVTLEELQHEFDTFCREQTSKPPPFRVIFDSERDENSKGCKRSTIHNQDVDIFSQSCIVDDGAFEEGGYDVVPSDVSCDEGCTWKPPATTEPLPDFSTEMVVYTEPCAIAMPRSGVRDLTTKGPLKDFSCTVGKLQVSDYRIALSAPHEIPHDERKQLTTCIDELYESFLHDRNNAFPTPTSSSIARPAACRKMWSKHVAK